MGKAAARDASQWLMLRIVKDLGNGTSPGILT